MMKFNKNQILVGVAVLAILITGSLIINNQGGSNKIASFLNLGMSDTAVAQKAVDYINAKQLAGPGQTVTLGGVSEESGLIKMSVKLGTNTIDSYVTKDGKLLFPQGISLGATTNSTTQPSAQITPNNVAKVAKTSLEAYVVSDCPYGLQMQRAIAEAVKSIPSLVDYVKVRYIGSVSGTSITSMHDGGPNGLEAKENLKQICLREEQPAKYWPYVSCYMQKATGALANTMPIGDSATCSVTAGVDAAKLNACISDPAKGLAYAKADFALDTKYNVTGSPTLILNGATLDETPFGGRSAKSIGQMICSSSTNPPAFCSNTKLSTDPAATSFSLTYAGTGATGATANCAPATN